MKITKLSEYFSLITTHDYDLSYEEQLAYLKKLEIGVESSDDAVALICLIAQNRFIEKLIN